MPIKDNPDIVDALDGLYHASVYADKIGEEELARTIGQCYQEMGATTVDEDADPDTNDPNDGWARALDEYSGSTDDFTVPDESR